MKPLEKLKRAGLQAMPLSSRLLQKRQPVDAEAASEHAECVAILQEFLKPGEELDFTNIVCMPSKRQPYHVYVGRSGAYKGVGKWKCLFCGEDDFDF